ncbi:flagellar hook-length control protein FliK [Bacillus sp. CGMCC 1.16541]|uniref:flagellar hook-length control protein FliK n=1 Tax=Bacillus sp. CGMCC 1.16541 TaxID=2185143 RepID=UPI000D7353ED|nr:flagellar hook-length control protein FliK [Bacillus sp. CGMCC 1.16541]
MNLELLSIRNERQQSFNKVNKQSKFNEFSNVLHSINERSKMDETHTSSVNKKPVTTDEQINTLMEIVGMHLQYSNEEANEESALFAPVLEMMNHVTTDEKDESELIQLVDLLADMIEYRSGHSDSIQVMDVVNVKNETEIESISSLLHLLKEISKEFTNQMQVLKNSLNQPRIFDMKLSKSELTSLLEVAKEMLAKVQESKGLSSTQLFSDVKKFSLPIVSPSLKANFTSHNGEEAKSSTGSFLTTPPSFVSGEMTRVQQFVLHVGNSRTKSDIDSEQFIKQVQEILSKSIFSKHAQQTRLVIKLFPEHLGSLQVELMKQDNHMIARIIASTATAKEALDDQIQSLKQAFANQQISIEKIEVQQQPILMERSYMDGHTKQQKEREKQSTDQDIEPSESTEENTFNETLQDALINYNV